MRCGIILSFVCWWLFAFCAGCAHSTPNRREGHLVDQTWWSVQRAVAEPSTVALRVEFADGYGEQARRIVRDSLERELASRGFEVQQEAHYLLIIRCEGPWAGLRGFPVVSRYAKVALAVRLLDAASEQVILEGQADGVSEEGEVYWAANAQRNLRKAIDSAVGKIGRQLVAAREPGAGGSPFGRSRPRTPLAPRPGDQRPTLAVLDFVVPRETEAGLPGALADVCRRTVQESEQFTLIARDQMERILGEHDFVALMNCEEMSCRVQYARLLAAEKLLLARVSRAGGANVLYMSLTDVGSGRVDANVLGLAADTKDLISLVEAKTWDLIEQAVKPQASQPAQ